MPFDGSGNFVRLYDFEQDRDNGVKILATRMDGEFDNFAGGMNSVFFRSGIVSMTGDINMGLNRIKGLSSGALGVPSIGYSADATTGLWLNGVGRLAVSASGASVAEFTSIGLTVPGNIGSTSFQASGSNFGGRTGAGAEVFFNSSEAVFQGYNRSSLAAVPLRVDGSTIRLSLGGVSKALLDGSGLNVSTPILQSGYQVWHAGNLNPANYPTLAGATFVGNVGAPAFLVDSTMYATLLSGNPIISFDTNDFITYSRSANAFGLVIGGTQVIGANATSASITGALGVSGSFNSVGAITQNGAQVWHTGNLTPSLYAPLANPAFTGTATGAFNGTVMQRSGATLYGTDNLNPALYAPLAGATFTNDIVRSGQGKYFYDGMNRASTKITDGTAAPAGGSDGDIYFQYV